MIFSALGSTMNHTRSTTTTGPMDVVLILDTSTSMDDTVGGVTRLQRVIEAANALMDDLLTIHNVRIAIVTYNADSETVLPLAAYNNGIDLVVTNYFNNGRAGAGVVTAYDDDGRELGKDNGYTMGTNLQSGIDRGFDILANATGVEGRVPVAIVLTDGQANRATQERFYNVIDAQDKDGTSASGRNLYLSTLLNAAYSKTEVETHYGREQKVYGIGVDLGQNTTAQLLMNPGDARNGFHGNHASRDVKNAYSDFQKWAAGQTITNNGWTFNHNYPTNNGAITDAKIAANINYVDTYYDVTSADLTETFDQIYVELSSGVFNPISTSTTEEGATGVDHTPLIYVDYIGQHMQIKEIQSVTLFGASYDVIDNADGTYTVELATGINPTTNEAWNTAEDILISVTKQADGTQKLEIKIHQEVLPIILEQVVSETVSNVTNSAITQFIHRPLRVFYTVGLSDEILLPNGELDISKLQGYSHINDAEGTVSLYAGQYGVLNPADGANVVLDGDAHVGFKPSGENRYYYHQSNQGIFTGISNKSDGSTVTIPENAEYGIVWDESKYDLTWMSYEEYQAAQDADLVYTYVTYYHPTPSLTDSATAAEEVIYLVYTNWGYLKESVAFYDNNTGKYVNYDAAKGYELAEEGVAIAPDQVAAVISAYKQKNPNADIYAVLGVGSLRTSRLHNMTVAKDPNATGTAVNRYTPEYTYETASSHNGNDVVVWLGNNGKITVNIDTGIVLTKNVTQAIGSAADTYALTVTLPAGVAATPVVKDSHGKDVTATISGYENNVLTVNLKAGETVYISGIPAGTQCVINENIPAGAEYYISDRTETVVVPLVSEVLNGAAQFAPAFVTNAPYGELTVAKDIQHNLEETPNSMHRKEFTFKVQLPVSFAGRELPVDKINATLFTGEKVTVGNDGSFTVKLKNNESITIMGLPGGTTYTVTEEGMVAGYENTSGTITGTVLSGQDTLAHFINTYSVTPIKPEILVTGTKTVEDVHNTYIGIDEGFVFQLSRYVGESQQNPDGYVPLASQTVKNGETYRFNLQEVLDIPLNIGLHYFRITEQSGATAGMTYDSTRGLFAVKVTDADADGVLEYTLENYANTVISGNTVTKDFTNIYDIERTHADVNITKVLTNNTGVNIPLDIFHFEMVNTANAKEKYVATTDASGKATIRVSNLAEGIYTYKLSETEGDMPGMTYDRTVYTVIITVTKEDGKLVAVAEVENAAPNGDDAVDVQFRNRYTLNATSHTISGTKVLVGRDIANGEFAFELYETDSAFTVNGAAKQTVSNTGKDFSFDSISYDRVGTHYYVVKEQAGSLPGVTYDTTHYHITVTIGVDSNHPEKLTVTDVHVNKIGHNTDSSGDVVFVNSYKATPTEYTLSGLKILHGRSIRSGEFSFQLYEGDNLLQTVTNKADGSFAFDAISYDKPGTYTYTVREVQGNAPGVGYDGVNHPITVTVTVTDTGAVLSASADVKNGDIRFENTYTAAEAEVTFTGIKKLEGDTLSDNAFTFRLYRTDNTFRITGDDVQLLDTAKNENGAFAFAKQSLTATGTYFFVIVEDASVDPVENVVYDGTQHRFAVQVNDVGDGQLRAVVTNMATNVTAAETVSASAEVTFTNATFGKAAEKEVYLAGSTDTNIDGKKVSAGDVLTYFITYTNYTGEDVVVDIMDIIPKHTSYVENSASHGGIYAGEHINWILHVNKGESVTVSFDVKVDETDEIVANTAVIRDGINTYSTNEVVNHTVENEAKKDVFAAADVTTSIDGQKVSAGQELVYAISYTNTSGEAVDIKITDRLPKHTTYVDGSADNGGVYADGKLEWNLEDVPAWSTVTVAFKVTVNANTGVVTVKNEATVLEGDNTYTTNEVTNEISVPKPTIDPSSPQTGDTTNLWIWCALLAVSGGGILTVLLLGRKKKTTEETE
ncbi:MAG: DUF11 domain-containing protein [Oscillospiraceae bacterium]|nr:DUF11 domain-containing protein [Oscillospiraceae bacterium]